MYHNVRLFTSVTILAALGSTAFPEPPASPAEEISEPTPAEKLLTGERPVPSGLLTPLPETGGVPPIVDIMHGRTERDLAFRAEARKYTRQIRRIAHKHFGRIKVDKIRLEGIEELTEFTDPAAFRPMVVELADEKDDVRLAVLDHLAEQGEAGQAALAWTAIHDEDPAIINEATRRLQRPASRPVFTVLDRALRSKKHAVVNNAGVLAGHLDAVETIPLLIFAQASGDPIEQEGDLAWIAIQTQTAYVANVQPVVGDGAGAFAPVIGVLNEGVLMRVHDAVVVTYRVDVHNALVAMTTREWGHSTAELGYNMPEWWAWYNEEFVPHMNRRAGL